jgi:uncharacterized protein YbaR (Trm112 family)
MRTISEETNQTMKLSPELLTMLVCPRCKGEIRPMDDDHYLVCRSCRLKYPVIDDIPLMLMEEAEKIGE